MTYNNFFGVISGLLADCDVDSFGFIADDPNIIIDSELGLFKSIQFNFSKGKDNPIQISLCTLHLKKNLSMYLKKQNLPKKIPKKIFKSIWIGPNSLVESADINEFTDRKLEFESNFSHYFESEEYINKYITKLLNHVLEVFWKTGQKLLTSNLAETLNSLIKRRMKHKVKKIPNLAIEIIRFFQAQLNYLEGAFQNRGE